MSKCMVVEIDFRINLFQSLLEIAIFYFAFY